MATVDTILLDENKRHRKYTGAEYFHAAGYFGERVVAATGESWALSNYNPGGRVLDPLGLASGFATHPISTAGVFFQFAPKAKLVMLNMASCQSTDPERCYIRFANQSLAIVKEYNILNQFNSFSQSYNATTRKMYEEAMEEVPDLKMFWCMGNDDKEKYSRITDLSDMFGVGAYKIMVSGEIVPEHFSSEAPTVDFAGPDLVAYSTSATSASASGSKPSGTSYATPAVCALSCLVDDFFIDKTGKPLSRPMMFQFLIDHCEDIGDEGFDQSMGYGAVRLPEPSTIDIEKYQPCGGDTSLTDPIKPEEEQKGTETTTLHSENSGIRKFTGVDKFHAAGYYGERVSMATGETWDIDNYNPDGLVEIPFGNGSGWGNFSGGHGTKTAATFFQVAPKSKLFQLGKISSARTGKTGYCGLEKYCKDIIIENNILGCFCSFDMISDKYLAEKYTNVINELKTFTLAIAAGNDATSDYTELLECDATLGVGAYYVTGTKAKPEDFTSQTEHVDIAGPDRQVVKFAKETGVTTYGKQEGTSFATPWVLGMIALVDDFFIDKTGKPLTREMMLQFIMDNLVDVGDEGFDKQMGHGAFILPDPESIDIKKYQPDAEEQPTEPEEPEESVMDRNNYKEIKDTKINDCLQVTEIPYDAIKEVGFAKCNDPVESVKSWYNRQEDKPQIVTNGGLYTLATGSNIMSFIDEGVEQNYQNNFEGIGVKYDNTTLLVAGVDKDGGWKDFMSAYPVLVENGKVRESFGNAADLNYGKLARQAIGVKKNGDVIIITADKKSGDATSASIASTGMQFEELANLFVEYGADYAINLDGGGSVYKMEFGEVANKPTETRAIDNVFYVKLKDVDDDSKNPVIEGSEAEEPVVDLPTIEPGTYYATEEIGLKAGVDTADHESKVIYTIPKGEEVTVHSTMTWLNKTWANVTANWERGYIWYTGSNLSATSPSEEIDPEPEEPVTDPDEPVDDPVEEDPTFVPGVYIVKVSTFLTVRDAPSMSGNAVGKLYNDTMISVDAIVNDNWAHIKCGEYEGKYCHTDYITRLTDYVGSDDPSVEIGDNDYYIIKLSKDIVDEDGDVVYTAGSIMSVTKLMEDVHRIDGVLNGEEQYATVNAHSIDIKGEILYTGNFKPVNELIYEGKDIGIVTDSFDAIPVLDAENVQKVYSGTVTIPAGSLAVVLDGTSGDIIVNGVYYNLQMNSHILNVKSIGVICSNNNEPVEPDEPEIPEEPVEEEDVFAKFEDKDLIKDCHKDGVEFVLRNGIMNGVSDTKFDPQGSVTREMLATVLYRYNQYLD